MKEKAQKKNCEIAIIGVGCNYPGAKSPAELWENILSRKQQFREMPDVRLPNTEYYDSDPLTPDKTYQNKSAVMDGYEFNWLERRIPKKTYESTDIVHWLALDTALQALENAGLKKENIPKDKMGVVLGNTLTGEFTRANQMLLRWPYVRKALRASLQSKGLSHLSGDLEGTMEKMYKSVFTPVTEDTLAGGLANTIAGRVCNYLDIHGGGYIVDGACSSSLLAITNAANYLELGQMDVVIAGGVDVSLDTFELVGFSKTRALTQDEMRVYDKKGKGFIPGEGCGMVVLKRLEDAQRDGDTVLATLMGWGISSDGKGGMTAPSAAGQSMALKRAYQKANFDTEKLNFIEGHGTGTTVGDKIELTGITLALNANKTLPKRNCGVTSFKSIVGHTKAAAGVGAFIKTVIALNQRVMPPTAGLKEFNPIFEDEAKTIYPLINGQIKDPKSTLYAGVSAMGFGGINSHVLLRSQDAPIENFKTTIDASKLLVTNQESELFSFTGNSINELITELELAKGISKGISYAELCDLACHINKKINNSHGLRASIVALTPFDLERKLTTLTEELKKSPTPEIINLEQGKIVFSKPKANLKIGAAFPGQGSQRLNMGRKLKQRHPWISELIKDADQLLSTEKMEPISDKLYHTIEKVIDQSDKLNLNNLLRQTNHAQPAIVIINLAWYKYLQRLGINIDYSIGHSLGELSSFNAAGHINEETLIKFAGFRGQSMANCGSGTMASLVCSKDKAQVLIDQVKGYATIANINAPEQTVISGEKSAIEEIIELAEKAHIAAVNLPVSAAFHSKLIKDTAEDIQNFKALNKSQFSERNPCKVVSSVSAQEIDKAIDLNQYFANQSVNQVNFIEAINTMKDRCDVMIEVGPGKVLSGLISNITRDISCFPMAATSDLDSSLNVMIANVFVAGANVNMDVLYEDRLIRPFIPASERKFLVNPLERPFPDHLLVETTHLGSASSADFSSHLNLSDEALKDYFNKRGSFINEVIASDMKHLVGPGNIPAFEQKKQTPKIITETKETNANSPQSETSIQSVLYEKLEEATGFPQKAYQADLKLLDDFNLDSIKAGTLLADFGKSLNIQGKFNANTYSNASIQSILEAVEKLVPKKQHQAANKHLNVKDAVLQLVVEHTGFPQEGIAMDFHLLDDLNLDSIKAGTLLGALSNQFGIKGKIQAANHANASLQQIVDAIEAVLPTQTSKEPTSDNINVSNEVFTLIEETTGFPQSDLNADYKLLDDLNLDSIKAGSLLAELSKRLKIQGKLEASKYANASIATIISALEKHLGQTNSENSPTLVQKSSSTIKESWVNAFEAELIEVAINTNQDQIDHYWKGKEIAFIGTKNKFNDQLLKQWVGINDRIKLIDFENQQFENKNYNPSIVISILPSGTDIASIKYLSKLLADIACAPNLRQADHLFIQQGDGSFGRDTSQNIDSLSAQGFASSLHHERPEQKFRVIAYPAKTTAIKLFNLCLQTLSAKKKYRALTLLKDKTFELQYRIAESNQNQEQIKLNKEDVVLITGGAKGITAECGLALSKKFGCKMALVGSSSLASGDTGITHTLKHYAKNKLTANYFSCDISNDKAVQELKDNVENTLGKVTAIIHGAGRNIPRLADGVNGEEAISEITPKVMGMANLLDTFSGNNLKQVCVFTSIIGVTGMQGNSWYAFANETTDLLLRRFKAQYKVPTLSLAYSVWSEIGMGARMGSVETLSHMGIGSIAPNQGIAQFLQWFENPAHDQQLVIASKLGGLDTWIRNKTPLPKASRYLEEVKYFEPGIEIEAHAFLDRKDDKYTDDHNYRGSLLLPTVFGLEAMAQAVAAVAGITKFDSLVMENISLTRPIVVPNKGKTTIAIKAETISKDEKNGWRIKAGIATESSDFEVDHFYAEFIVGQTIKSLKKEIATEKVLAIEPKTDLYSWLLFQGKRFQLIDKVYTMTEKQAIFATHAPHNDTSEICLSENVHKPFIIGSPLLRDTLLQSFQLSLTKKLVLPVRIKRWTFINPAIQTYGGLVQCDFVKQEGKTYDCDVHYTTVDGDVIEHIEGYQVQELGDQAENPSPEQITDVKKEVQHRFHSRIEEVSETFHIPELILDKATKSFHLVEESERHEIEQEVLRKDFKTPTDMVVSPEDLQLSFDTKGKPNLNHKELNISISHTNTWLLMSVGQSEQACDIEMIANRDASIWVELLGADNFQLAEQLSQADSSGIAQKATELWTVKETVFKRFGAFPESIIFKERINTVHVYQAIVKDEQVYIACIKMELYPGVNVIIALALEYKLSQTLTPTYDTDSNERTSLKEYIYNAEHGKFKYDFLATFKDCRGFYGKTYFTNFPLWMGSLRENVLSPVKDQLLKDLGSGEYGMVTNDSSVHIYNEADSLDDLIGTLSFTDKCDFSQSFMDFKYEWFKQSAKGELIKIADCYLSTTWVKIVDRGIVKKDPLPSYFVEFLEKYHHPEHKNDFKQEIKGQEFFTKQDLGAIIFKSNSLPRPEIVLCTNTYQTGMSNGNSVGNLYYSNYYDWQAKTIESYLYPLIPEIYLQNGKAGEYFCLECNVNHLQEAMPFEEIEVKMYLEGVYEHGVQFFFEYFSLAHGERRKLSYGSNTLIWCERKEAYELPKLMPTPPKLLNEMIPKQFEVN